jgi:hypothetical protein
MEHFLAIRPLVICRVRCSSTVNCTAPLHCWEVNIHVTHSGGPRCEYLVHLMTLSFTLDLYSPNNRVKIKSNLKKSEKLSWTNWK